MLNFRVMEMRDTRLRSSLLKKYHNLTIFRSPYWCVTDIHQHGVFILGSVNFWDTFRGISEVSGNAQA